MGFSNVSILLIFTLVLGAVATLPNIRNNFGRAIDAYASYQPQTTCLSVVQPGTARIAKFWKKYNPGVGSGIGILRACSDGDRSEHKEGRAMDYMLSSHKPAEAAVANQVISWLLATDKYGNKHAMVRRMGLMYMIWNNKIWGAYRAGDGWRPYAVGGQDCATKLTAAKYDTACHRDHIHMSFGWPGAKATTSFFKLAISRAEVMNTTITASSSHHASAWVVPVVVTVCAVVVVVAAIVAVLLFVLKNRSESQSRKVHLLATNETA